MSLNLPAAEVTLATEDRETYDKIFAFYIRRGYEDMRAGEVLVSDHALHDVLVQDNVWAKDRRLIRVRFTGLEDMRSRRLVGYAWSQEGSSRSFTAALRMALQRYGKPRVFYFDNGKDYQKVGRGARGGTIHIEDVPAEAMGVIARIEAEVKFCRPFGPQAKPIERLNRTLHDWFDRRWSTYCGSKPEDRPEQCSKMEARHKFLMAHGRVEESEVPLASEFIRAARLWIEAEYNVHPMDVEGVDNESPVQAWEHYKWSGLAPVDFSTLTPLLMSRCMRKIHRGRILMHKGEPEYIAADPQSSIALHDHSGDDNAALVLYDESDDSFIAAADENGYVFAYLCKETLLRQSDDEETRSAIAASMQERSRHFKRTKANLLDLDRRALAAGYVPQKHQMLQLGNLPIPIDDVVVHRPQKTKIKDIVPESPMTPAEAARRLLEGKK